jgi:hypothetical protein
MQEMQDLNSYVEVSCDSNKGHMKTLDPLLNILKRQRKSSESGQDISTQVKTKMFAIHWLRNLKENKKKLKNYIPWSEPASELHRQSDRRLSAK